MASDHHVEESNLSLAWGKALLLASARGRSEICPLVVHVTGFKESGEAQEEPTIRGALDNLLMKTGRQSVETVANTIFPASLWNREASRHLLFERYQRISPRLRKVRANNHGIYFERMIAGGPKRHPNQLDFAISTYLARRGVRRSVLQVGVFDPNQDHSAAALRGFPCLQHVSFSPVGGELRVNAFYASQYLVERAYGNYLGLCRLGRFVAHEMKLRLTRMTCLVGIAECEVPKKHVSSLLEAIGGVIDRPPE